MNGNWTDAETWIDIVDHVWIGFVVVAVAAVPSWFAARNHKSIKKVQDQVVNGHTTPMRADLDDLADSVKSMSRNVRDDMQYIKSELSDIRSDLNTERKERMSLDNRFEQYRKSAGAEGNS